MQDKVTLKGIGDKIEIHLSPLASYPEIKHELIALLEKNKNFFCNADVNVVINGKLLSEAEATEIKYIFHMEYNIYNVYFYDEYEKLKKACRDAANSLSGNKFSSDKESIKIIVVHQRNGRVFEEDELTEKMKYDIASVIEGYTGCSPEDIVTDIVFDINENSTVSYLIAETEIPDKNK